MRRILHFNKMWWLFLAVVAADESMLECECRRLSRLTESADGWHVALPSCSGTADVGPYESRGAALADVPRLRLEMDACVHRIATTLGPDEAVELELARLRISELEHDLEQLKADNDLLIKNEGLEDFRTRILDYLDHSTGNDDVLPSS